METYGTTDSMPASAMDEDCPAPKLAGVPYEMRGIV